MKRLVRLMGRLPAAFFPRADCPRVRRYLAAYASCDPSLSESEYRAVEEHLRKCRPCQHALSQADELLDRQDPPTSLGNALPPLDAYAMAHRILTQKTPAQVVLPAPNTAKWRLGWDRPAAALAIIGVFTLAVPVLAYVGHEVCSFLAGASGPHKITVQDPFLPNETLGALPGRSTGPQNPALSLAQSAETFPPVGEALFLAELDTETVWLSAHTKIEATLPQNDREYEAWARREYPHVMWLYDVLRSPDTGLLWKGRWQELLVYSGESLAFDWPRASHQTVCRPRIGSLIAAAETAGFRLAPTEKDGYPLPALPWQDLDRYGLDGHLPVYATLTLRPQPAIEPPRPALPPETFDEYGALLAQNHDLAESVFAHLVIAFNLTMDELARSAPTASHENLRNLRDEALYLLCDLAVPAGENASSFASRCSNFFQLKQQTPSPGDQ